MKCAVLVYLARGHDSLRSGAKFACVPSLSSPVHVFHVMHVYLEYVCTGMYNYHLDECRDLNVT